MKYMFALALVVLASCNQPTIPNDPHPGYPCGFVEHSCGNGFCCPNNSDCGGVPSCGDGLCCYAGGTFAARKTRGTDGGARP